jgi:hypothetical protein
MPFDDAADFAGVCAKANKPANNATASPMNQTRNEFISASVFRSTGLVQPHQSIAPIDEDELSCVNGSRCLSAVLQLRCAGRACTVDTTEDFFVRLDTVSDDTAVAVGANRRQRVDCALEAIKDVALAAHDYFKRLVIIVLANFALRHTQFVRARGGQWRCLICCQAKIQRAFFGRLGISVLARAEILLVLNDAESYHWSPSLRVGAVIHANAKCRRHRPHYS